MDKQMDDKSIWETYSPILNSWFSSELIYEGFGKASFENPVGTIEGKTIISVNEIGDLKIEMKYEQLNTDIQISGNSESFRILKFLHRSFEKNDQVAIGIGDHNRNPCSRLIVKTTDGIFTSEGNIFWSAFSLNNRIVFWINGGSFETKKAGKPQYWVAPLTNFISTFHLNPHPLLTQHPLRLYTTPIVPDIEDEKQKNIALFAANRRNSLIGFYFGEKVGFIEPMPDYTEREERLKSGQDRQCITVLMVSEIDKDIYNEWFPREYTNLISFASGAEVGVSWLEFRDGEGNLVSRKHFSTHKTIYEKEYAAIDEAIHGGLGPLLSLASNSQEFKKDIAGILINHLIRLSPRGYQIEDHMTLLSRAFESLSASLDLRERYLKAYLPSVYEENVDTALNEARQKIRGLRHQAKTENLFDVGAALERVESNLSNANNKDGSFGMKVLDILKHYNMTDYVTMERYYSEHPKANDISWIQILNVFRNAVIHDGYFQIQNGTHDFNEILAVENHLHDILVRIVLKIIGYEEKYQPRVIEYLTDSKTVNWVNEKTSATELGYEKRNHL